MTRIILVRHGQSTANLKHIFAGHKDEELTELGHMQAEKTAEFLADHYAVDAIYASDLSRAYQTAMHMAEHFQKPVIAEPKLREIYAAKWQGVSFDEILKNYTEDYTIWLNDIGNARCTNGESVEELSERITCKVADIVEQNIGKTILIVTHATPIRALQCKWSGMSLDAMKDIPWVPNSSVTVVIYEDGDYRIEVCGEDSYLEGIKSGFPANV